MSDRCHAWRYVDGPQLVASGKCVGTNRRNVRGYFRAGAALDERTGFGVDDAAGPFSVAVSSVFVICNLIDQLRIASVEKWIFNWYDNKVSVKADALVNEILQK